MKKKFEMTPKFKRLLARHKRLLARHKRLRETVEKKAAAIVAEMMPEMKRLIKSGDKKFLLDVANAVRDAGCFEARFFYEKASELGLRRKS